MRVHAIRLGDKIKKTKWKVIVPVLAAILLLSGFLFFNERKDGNLLISTFGKYQGYSMPVYDGTQRTSEYLTLSDGTRLAYDLIIPTQKGIMPKTSLPVLFKYTPTGEPGQSSIITASSWWETLSTYPRLPCCASGIGWPGSAAA